MDYSSKKTLLDQQSSESYHLLFRTGSPFLNSLFLLLYCCVGNLTGPFVQDGNSCKWSTKGPTSLPDYLLLEILDGNNH